MQSHEILQLIFMKPCDLHLTITSNIAQNNLAIYAWDCAIVHCTCFTLCMSGPSDRPIQLRMRILASLNLFWAEGIYIIYVTS